MIFRKTIFILTRLWQYLSLYFLKPFDAINDTLTSSILYSLNWDGNIVELGSGDGEFSYVMHGGKFPLWYDRYLDTDLSKKDIFDTHIDGQINGLTKLSYPNIILSIDAKENHVKKIKEIGFSKNAKQSLYENLPLNNESVEKIFYYTPHGLKDHDIALNESIRILKKKGKILILLYNSEFKESFLCHKIANTISNEKIANYFNQLDNGRFNELIRLSKTKDEWIVYFKSKGLKVNLSYSGLSTTAWKFYDIQTRPFLKKLVIIFNYFPLWLRTILKVTYMLLLFPFLLIFYIVFSNEFIIIDKKNCYFSFELEKL